MAGIFLVAPFHIVEVAVIPLDKVRNANLPVQVIVEQDDFAQDVLGGSNITIGLGTLDVGFKVAEGEVTVLLAVVDVVEFQQSHLFVHLTDDTLPRSVTLQLVDIAEQFLVLFYNGLLLRVMTVALQCEEAVLKHFNGHIL